MEQKIMKQIDDAIELYNNRLKKAIEDYEQLEREILTPEITNMMKTILDAQHYCYYKIPSFEDKGYNLYMSFDENSFFGENRISFKREYSRDSSVLRPNIHCLFSTNREELYSKKTIDDLKRNVDNLPIFEKEIESLQTYGPLWIEDVAERYKSITETQTNTLNEIFKELGRDTNPIKHIKVTVEWI